MFYRYTTMYPLVRPCLITHSADLLLSRLHCAQLQCLFGFALPLHRFPCFLALLMARSRLFSVWSLQQLMQNSVHPSPSSNFLILITVAFI